MATIFTTLKSKCKQVFYKAMAIKLNYAIYYLLGHLVYFIGLASLTSTRLMMCCRNSWASCCLLEENSRCPLLTRAFSIRGEIPFCWCWNENIWASHTHWLHMTVCLRERYKIKRHAACEYKGFTLIAALNGLQVQDLHRKKSTIKPAWRSASQTIFCCIKINHKGHEDERRKMVS